MTMKTYLTAKRIFLTCLVTVTSGCATIPPARTADENAQALSPLVKAGDRDGIEQYFKTYSWCDKSDVIAGCSQKDKGLLIGSSHMTAEEFLSAIDEAHRALADGLAKCGDRVECLSKIYVSGHPVCGDSSDSVCKITSKYLAGKKAWHVDNPEMAGTGLTLTDADLKQLRERFVTAAQKANESSDVAQKTNDVASSTRAKVFSQIREAHCIQLGGYQISQKLAPHQYEIGIGDSVHGGQCFETGDCTEAFKVEGGHAILETTKVEFNSQGYIPDSLYVKPAGNRNARMKNGFAQKLPVYRESVKCEQIAKPLYTH